MAGRRVARPPVASPMRMTLPTTIARPVPTISGERLPIPRDLGRVGTSPTPALARAGREPEGSAMLPAGSEVDVDAAGEGLADGAADLDAVATAEVDGGASGTWLVGGGSGSIVYVVVAAPSPVRTVCRPGAPYRARVAASSGSRTLRVASQSPDRRVRSAAPSRSPSRRNVTDPLPHNPSRPTGSA